MEWDDFEVALVRVQKPGIAISAPVLVRKGGLGGLWLPANVTSQQPCRASDQSSFMGKADANWVYPGVTVPALHNHVTTTISKVEYLFLQRHAKDHVLPGAYERGSYHFAYAPRDVVENWRQTVAAKLIQDLHFVLNNEPVTAEMVSQQFRAMELCQQLTAYRADGSRSSFVEVWGRLCQASTALFERTSKKGELQSAQ